MRKLRQTPNTPARSQAALKGNITCGAAVICATASGGWMLPGGREIFCREQAGIAAQRLDRIITTTQPKRAAL